MNEHLKLLQELSASHYRKARAAMLIANDLGQTLEALEYLARAQEYQQLGAAVTLKTRELMNVEQAPVLETVPESV